MIKIKFLTINYSLLTFNSNAAFDIKARTAILQDFFLVKFCMKKMLINLFIQPL